MNKIHVNFKLISLILFAISFFTYSDKIKCEGIFAIWVVRLTTVSFVYRQSFLHTDTITKLNQFNHQTIMPMEI